MPNLPDETLRRLTGKPELTRDAQIRTIARDVLKIDIDEAYQWLDHTQAFELKRALNAAFLAGMDFQRKQAQNAE